MTTHTTSTADTPPPHRVHRPDPASPAWHRWARRLAIGGSVCVLAVFTWFALRGVVPRTPEFEAFEQPIQLTLLGLYAFGAIVAVRAEGLGGSIMLVAAVLLGVLAAVEFSPVWSLLAFATFGAPAVLHLLGWRRTRSWAVVTVVLGLVVVCSTAAGVAAYRVHDHFFGPTHPSSTAANPPVDVVRWVWAGATTSTSFQVRAALADTGVATAELVVSSDPGLGDALVIGPAPVDATGIVAFEVTGLAPAGTYYYAVHAAGRTESSRRGSVRTFPDGAASFTFAVASCARTDSNGAVFDAIRAADPDFYVGTGDLFYGDVTADDPAQFDDLYERTLTSPGQSALYRSTSIVYTWDDHDYGGNDATASSPSRPAALDAYQRHVPHSPFAGHGIAQAFTVGRVRIVVTDGRSMRDPDADPPTLLGDAQRAWLIDEIVTSSRDHALVVWVNASPWITKESSGSDSWQGFTEERRNIADAIERADVHNLLMVSGDAHMLAIDDGSNNRFSSSGEPGFPVFQAAPLDRPAGVKGGPYSEGTHAAPGQFGLVHVTDNGDRVDVLLEGRTWDGGTPISYEFSVPAPTGP